MGAKSKKRKQQLSTAFLYEHAERNLKKGNLREAVKEARRCYADEPSEKHKQLLQFAYIARAQELARYNLTNDCRAIVDALLQLGAVEPAVAAALPDLYIFLGMLDRLPKDRSPAPDASDRENSLPADILAKIADRAVARPHNAPPSLLDVRQAAEQVRAALAAVCEGNDVQAMELLREIPRQSPLADWKLFVRGLSAYYSNNVDEMLANWNRLDPHRRAARIARPLRATVIPSEQDPSDAKLQLDIQTVKRATVRSPVLQVLQELERLIQAEKWQEFVAKLLRARNEVQKLDASLLNRLLLMIADQLIQAGEAEILNRLARKMNGPASDPRWNRARALVLDQVEPDSEESLPFWHAYLDDVQHAGWLSENERAIAQGLIHLRIAEKIGNIAECLRNCQCGKSHDEDVNLCLLSAKVAFEACIAKLPDYGHAYHSLARAYESNDDFCQAAGIYKRLLEHVPTDLQALDKLVLHHLSQREGVIARDYALQLRRHRPLDKYYARLTGRCHLAAASQYAQRGEVDAMQQEYIAARLLLSEPADSSLILSHEAASALKMSQPDRAKLLLDQAIAQFEDAAPVWLALLIELTLNGSKELIEYELYWEKALAKKCRSQSAGCMCRALIFAKETAADDGPFQDFCHTLTALYLDRCGRVKWREEDLLWVCRLLSTMDEAELLLKYAKQGRRLFPQQARFHMWVGDYEYEKGPFDCDYRLAKQCFEKVIEIAKELKDSEVQQLAKVAAPKLEALSCSPGGLDMSASEKKRFFEHFRDFFREAGIDS